MPLVDIIGIKPVPGDHKCNFEKVGAIPCEPFRIYRQVENNRTSITQNNLNFADLP